MSKYRDWITEQLEYHEREIAKLTVAQMVLIEADKVLAPASPRQPKQLPKGKQRRRPRVVGKTRALVMEAVATLGTGPWQSHVITDAVKAAHPEIEDKMLWNALYNAKRVNALVQDPATKLYSLPEQEQSDAQEAA